MRPHATEWHQHHHSGVLTGVALAVVVVLSLAACGQTPTPPATLAPTVTPLPSATHALAPPPTSAPAARPTPTLLSTSAPTFTPAPSPAPTPVLSKAEGRPPSPSPTLAPPPLLAPIAGEPLPLSLGWRFSANGHLTAGTATELAGQPAYLLASLGRTVYALTDSGEVRWQARTAGPVYALAVLDGDKVAVGDDAGFVTLFDARGQRLWRRAVGSRVTAVHAAWEGGLLAGGWDEHLTSLSADGEVRWQASLGGPASSITLLSDPSTAPGPGLAIVATLDGAVQSFDPSGADVWRFDAGAPVTAIEGLGDGVLVGLQDGRLLALDATGALRWQQTLGAATEGSPVWRVADWLSDGKSGIIAGTGGSEPVLALLSAEGEILWRVAVPSPVGAITALDLDGAGALAALVGLASGEMRAYDGQGRQRGSVHAGLSVWGLETKDGTVLVRADVVAWQVAGVEGPGGGPWLPPPAMAPLPPILPPVAEKGTSGEVILAFVGDVAPGRSMELQLARYGPAYPWGGLGPLLADADLAVANLECVLATQGEPLDKRYLIRAHPRWGQTLLEGGFDLVTVGNNHALDYGPAGLDETLETLEGLGLKAVGAGRSYEEAHRAAFFDLDGVRLAVLGYAAARWNGTADVPATERIAWAEPAAVQADVRAARDQADVVVVLLHAGAEYAAEPSPDQVAVAHAAVDAGADLVVGHHPHVTQTVERYKNGLIAYSLGDALFDIPRPAAMQGDLLRVHITREGIVQAELWPFWIDDAIRPRLLDDGQGGPRFEVVYP